MAKVVDDGHIGIYVYDGCGNPVDMPHCTVRWEDGEALVALPSLRVVFGTLPDGAYRLLTDNHTLICYAWDELNVRR
jgi:hypothetical protein